MPIFEWDLKQLYRIPESLHGYEIAVLEMSSPTKAKVMVQRPPLNIRPVKSAKDLQSEPKKD